MCYSCQLSAPSLQLAVHRRGLASHASRRSGKAIGPTRRISQLPTLHPCRIAAPAGMLSTQAAARPVGRAGTLRVYARSRNSITPWGAQQPAAAGGVGDRLLPLLRTPFDLLALPGRVALGAVQSIPEVLEKM